MAGKSFDPRFHRLLLVLAAICSTMIGLLLLFPLGSGVSGKNTFFNINVLRDFVGIPNSNDQLPKDKLLGGLLATSIDEESCISRYQANSYWKYSDHKPSPYLIEKLRTYEILHKKCGPYTKFYNKSIEMLKSNKTSDQHIECSYVVWLAEAGGLGNRIISIISGFLYAILNNKILLLNYGEDFKDLFCEPFPETTWTLPFDFPIADKREFWGDRAPLSFGKLLKDKAIDFGMNNTSRLPFAYIHIMHDSSDMDSMFFCDGAQNLLRMFPWLLVRANNYYVPGLFLIPQYQAELDRLFPEKDTVFHHLARYLLHPTNSVWGYITRYYNTYLANAKVKVGIQIRDLPFASADFDYRLAQVINCTQKENLLPRINLDELIKFQNKTEDRNLKAILVASLDSGYHERIKEMYYEHSSLDGEYIGVYQASHEGYQQTSKQSHNVKALSEIYLLSFSDLLVTSEQSTFGYCAHGLGGLKPWIMKKPGGENNPCEKAMSMEPCFLDPPHCDCTTLKFKDPSLVVPHVRNCEDSRGVKLFN